MLKTKRIYENPEKEDGLRILVDRIWPRGMKKDAAEIDEWAKEIAPSLELIRWYSHEPRRWREFKLNYFKELKHDGDKEAEIKKLARLASRKNVTLLYSTRELKMNQAEALKQYIEKQI